MTLRYEIPGKSTGANLPILGFDTNQLVSGSMLYIEPARDGLHKSPLILLSVGVTTARHGPIPLA